MARAALVVMLAACSDPAAVPDAGTDAAPDALIDVLAVAPIGHDFGEYEPLVVAATPGGTDSIALTGTGL